MGAARMRMEHVAFTVASAASVAARETFEKPEVEGVPDTMPAVVAVSPSGRPVAAQLYGG
ncbi:MAG: hypothetical protein WDO73_17825 [Ignavibacteriota bacterium]